MIAAGVTPIPFAACRIRQLCALLLAGALLRVPAAAQVPRAEKPQPDRPPARETVEIETADGVMLKGALYLPEDPGRETPIAVLLPDAGESHEVFDSLAKRMQRPRKGEDRPAIAALSISLRGQGDSTKQRLPGGGMVKLKGKKLSLEAMRAMPQRDLEAIRQFLVDRNDAGQLNLNRLAYVGAGVGAIVATNGAAIDWSVPEIIAGKQGKDVKALVLLSPPWKYKGLTMLEPIRQPGVRKSIATMLMYGAKSDSSRGDAQRILRQLRKGRPDEPPPADGLLPTVVDVPGDTALQGTRWLKRGGDRAEDLIIRFITQHAASPDCGWSQRRLD